LGGARIPSRHGRPLPPLIISEGEIDELLRTFGKALDETADALTR